jgi:hypothetical protein
LLERAEISIATSLDADDTLADEFAPDEFAPVEFKLGSEMATLRARLVERGWDDDDRIMPAVEQLEIARAPMASVKYDDAVHAYDAIRAMVTALRRVERAIRRRAEVDNPMFFGTHRSRRCPSSRARLDLDSSIMVLRRRERLRWRQVADVFARLFFVLQRDRTNGRELRRHGQLLEPDPANFLRLPDDEAPPGTVAAASPQAPHAPPASIAAPLSASVLAQAA